MKCEVCESPAVSSLHFGARTCKACAAFFRRTVSMNMNYVCVGGGEKCRIHFEMRNICRLCRYTRCIHAGMKAALVRSQPKRVHQMRLRKRRSSQSSSDSDTVVPSSESTDEMQAHGAASTSSRESLQPMQVMEIYVKLEEALGDRRKIMYTDVKIRELYSERCELPYRESDLRRFDYRNFSGYVRHDFLMVFDYLKGFPDFEKLSLSEKNVFFRYACAVDSMITSAYYTYRLGKKSNYMVMFNGEYVPMEPLPISGLEPGAESLFESESDFNKYRSLMPYKIKQWANMCVPFWELHASFKEYALLKALTIWHIMFYKLSPNGRKVCQRQREAIIQALHQMCTENNIDPSVRIGSLLLAMSYVMEQVHTLLYNYTMITLFEMIKCDPVLIEVCSL